MKKGSALIFLPNVFIIWIFSKNLAEKLIVLKDSSKIKNNIFTAAQMWVSGLSCAAEERSEYEEDQRRFWFFFLPALQFSCLRSSLCQPACVRRCGCVCTFMHTFASASMLGGQSSKITFYCWRGFWMAQTICCFSSYAAACLSAQTAKTIRTT